MICQARKSRDADHLQNFVYDREMIDARDLDEAIQESRRNAENIDLPDYTFDFHTRKGKKQDNTKDDFFQSEFFALQPRGRGDSIT